MKIAFVSDAIWPYNKGGKEKRLFDVSTRLAQLHDVHIFSMKWWSGPNSIKRDGMTIHALCPRYALYSGKRRSIRQGILFGLSCLKLIREDWDVIDVDHMPFFPLFFVKIVCLLRGKKMTATWHEVWGREYWVRYMGVSGLIASGIERISVWLPDSVISVSADTTQKLKNVLGYHKTVATLVDGIDTRHIDALAPSKTRTDILYAGRLLSHKNVHMLLNAVKLLEHTHTKIRCTIIGEGPELPRLRLLAHSLRLEKNVVFKPFFDNHDDLIASMKAARIFVLPSEREGFGVVVLEARASGTPVVTVAYPDNAAAGLMKNGVHGFIAEGTPESLAATIQKTFNQSKKLRPKLGIERYDWKNVMSAFNSFFTNTL